MTLVTRCPDCHAVFRLTGMQLHSGNGSVRCGQCKQVFNGFVSLITVPEAYIQPAAISAEPAPDRFESGDVAVAPIAGLPSPADHFGVQLSARKTSRWWLISNALLLLLLLGQIVHAYRTEIFIAFPAFQPVLEDYCNLVQCEIDLPRHLHLLSLESSDLRVSSPAEPDVVALSAIIRNHAPFPQMLPTLLLTLNDSDGKPLASRIFSAGDYLDSVTNQSVLDGNSEMQVQCFLNTSGLDAVGYKLELVYQRTPSVIEYPLRLHVFSRPYCCNNA